MYENLYEEIVVNKKSIKNVAKQLNVCTGTIYKEIKKRNITLPRFNITELANNQEFRKLCNLKIYSRKELQLKFNVTRNKLEQAFKQLNIKYRKKNITYINQLNNQFINDRIFYNIQRNAASRKIQFNLTIEILNGLYINQNKLCKISNTPINFSNKSHSSYRSQTSASLDRIDSSIGYIVGNVQWVHKIINNMKGTMTDQEFIDWCKTVSDYQKSNTQT